MRQQRQCLATPQLDRRIRALDPALVTGVQMNGNIAEGATPFDHGRVEVRMRYPDAGKPPKATNQADGRLIEHGNAVPQYVAVRRAAEDRALTDCKRRLRADADHTRLVLAKAVEMPRRQTGKRRPGLPAWRHILAFLFANLAKSRRFIAG